MPFDKEKMDAEGMDTSITDEEVLKIKDGIEHINDSDVDKIVEWAKAIVDAENKREAMVDNALILGKMVLMFGSSIA